MMEDINLDFLKPEEVPKCWFRIMDTYHLSQLIDEPTRIKSGSKTCIDHIYVTNPEHVRAKNVSHIGLSDHFPVCYVCKHNSTSHTGTHNTIKYKSYKNFDEQALLKNLTTTQWNIIDMFDNTNDALDCWKYLFLDAPMMERRVKRPKQSDWFSDDIKEAIYLRDKYSGTSVTKSAKF